MNLNLIKKWLDTNLGKQRLILKIYKGRERDIGRKEMVSLRNSLGRASIEILVSISRVN